MFLFVILSSARWPNLCSISQGTSGFGCFMTQCSSLKMQRCRLKPRVRTLIYNCLWPKCCCCCSRALVLPWHGCWGPCGRAWPKAELLLAFSSPRAPVLFVLEHTCPQCQIFLPGCSVWFPLEFLELQILFYPLTLFFHSNPLYEFGLLGVDALFYPL